MKEKLLKVWDFLKGKKSYAVALAGFVYGMYTKDTEVVLASFALIGLRNGITNEISKVVTKKRK